MVKWGSTRELLMALFQVKLSRQGGGSGVFTVEVNSATPDEARRQAEHQNPGYVAQSVRRVG